MKILKSNFDNRVSEIDEYLRFLRKALVDGAVISPKIGSKNYSSTQLIGSDVSKILKANLFLILYNLAESTMRLGLSEIYMSIHQEKISYDLAIEQIRTIWIRDRLAKLENTNANHSKIREAAKSMIDEVLDAAIVNVNSDVLPIAGNLDARKIREIAATIGFSSAVPKRARGGEKLLTVKTMRNNLAHGNLSFTECGRDFDINDLEETKRQVISYLRAIVNNIDKYISNKKFQKA
jgi:hypothetical protein